MVFTRKVYAEIFQFSSLFLNSKMRARVSSQYLRSSVLSSSCFCLARWHLAIAITSLEFLNATIVNISSKCFGALVRYLKSA